MSYLDEKTYEIACKIEIAIKYCKVLFMDVRNYGFDSIVWEFEWYWWEKIFVDA